jgi:hypothetical protein
LTKSMCMYAFYVPMALAGSPQFTLNLFREGGTTVNTLRLWHYVRRDGSGSVTTDSGIPAQGECLQKLGFASGPMNRGLARGGVGVRAHWGDDGALFFDESRQSLGSEKTEFRGVGPPPFWSVMPLCLMPASRTCLQACGTGGFGPLPV